MAKRKQKSSVLKRIFWFFALLCIALGLSMAMFIYSPLLLPKPQVDVHIKQGTSLRGIANVLVKQQVLSEPWRFIVLVKLTGQSEHLQAGDYQLKSPLTAMGLIGVLNHGLFNQVKVQFIEGTTFYQMRKKLSQYKKLTHQIDQMTDEEVMMAVSGEAKHPEGWFYPDTYFVSPNTSDIDLLKRAYQKMQNRLATEWTKRAGDVPYADEYEALIMASIIEKETAAAEEREMIAGVFVNRLRIGMRLQTDPTIIYGMGRQYRGNITRRDLTKDTPYNTYTRDGLPPTPIAMPSGEAIAAALHPATTDALYFVANGHGRHVFSSDLKAHNQAVRQYQLRH
jgi:UPF0755 protein